MARLVKKTTLRERKERDFPTTRKIGGKVYRFAGGSWNRGAAIDEAKQMRRYDGKRVRVIKTADGFYSLYARKQ